MASQAKNLWVLLGLSLVGILLMKVVKVDFGAFVERFEILPPPQPAPPKAPHPLTGLSFAVSDLFDVVTKEASAEIAKEKGNEAFKAKNWQRAVGFYTDAIKLNSKIATYFSNRAAAHLELGSFLQAEADCTKAIDLDKKNVKAYVRRGTAREMLSYYKKALEDFRYALVLEPTNKRAAMSADRLKKLFQ